MNFLSPYVLTGLVSISVPIIVHQLTRRSRRVRELPTVQFLKRASEHTQSYRRLREWLLLLIRMLILTALVLAFARPYFSGRSATAGGKDSERRMVLLIDQSASMGFQAGDRSLMDLARDRADEIVTSNASSDAFTVIGYSDTVNVRVRDGSSEEARDVIDQINLRLTNTRTAPALRYAETIPDPKTVVLVTDLARHGFPRLDEASYALDPEQLKIIDVSVDHPHNQWMESISRLPAQPRTIRLKTSSVGKNRSDTAAIYFSNRSETRPLDISQSSVDIELSGPRASGYVEFRPDSFPLDRRWFFSLTSPEKREVYTRLGSTAEPYLDAFQSVNWRDLSPGDDLPPSGVVVLGQPIESPSFADRLRQFVRRGGRLIVFNDALSRNDELGPGNLIPVKFQGVTESSSGERLRLFNGGGEFFQGLPSATITSPLFFEYLSVQSIGSSRVYATLSSGAPFLVRRGVGDGSVVFLNTTLDASSSDWVTHPLFPVLMHRLVGKNQSRGSINIRATSEGWNGPGTPEKILSMGHSSGGSIDSQEDIHFLPGLYEVVERRFAVNVPTGESNPAPVKIESLKDALAGGGSSLSLESGQERGTQFMTQSDEATDDTWQWFLVVAIVLMIPEFWLGAKRRRDGDSS